MVSKLSTFIFVSLLTAVAATKCADEPSPCCAAGATGDQCQCVFGDHCRCLNGYVCSDTQKEGECTTGTGDSVSCVLAGTPVTSCPAGQEPDTAKTACAACADGKVSTAADMNACASCPQSGSEPNSQKTACVAKAGMNAITVCSYTSSDGKCGTGESCTTQYNGMPCKDWCPMLGKAQNNGAACGACGKKVSPTGAPSPDMKLSCPATGGTATTGTTTGTIVRECYSCSSCGTIGCDDINTVCGGACFNNPGYVHEMILPTAYFLEVLHTVLLYDTVHILIRFIRLFSSQGVGRTSRKVHSQSARTARSLAGRALPSRRRWLRCRLPSGRGRWFEAKQNRGGGVDDNRGPAGRTRPVGTVLQGEMFAGRPSTTSIGCGSFILLKKR